MAEFAGDIDGRPKLTFKLVRGYKVGATLGTYYDLFSSFKDEAILLTRQRLMRDAEQRGYDLGDPGLKEMINRAVEHFCLDCQTPGYLGLAFTNAKHVAFAELANHNPENFLVYIEPNGSGSRIEEVELRVHGDPRRESACVIARRKVPALLAQEMWKNILQHEFTGLDHTQLEQWEKRYRTAQPPGPWH